MDRNLLKHFYRFNGIKNEFIKNYFIRLIRNRIIDPNTKELLDRGFKFYSRKTGELYQVPCDDSNFNEFVTFDIGFKNKIFGFPFTIKLHHDTFISLESYDEFVEIFNKMIKTRSEIVKKGWAIKYGVEYDNEEFSLLEDLSESELLEWKDPRQDVVYTLDKLTEDDLKR
jgi:hypothetical protein